LGSDDPQSRKYIERIKEFVRIKWISIPAPVKPAKQGVYKKEREESKNAI
jgi:hypothetical protein